MRRDELILKRRLEPFGFHGFARHVKTGMLHFFGRDGYKQEYFAVLQRGKYELFLNAQIIGVFSDADEMADFILV